MVNFLLDNFEIIVGETTKEQKIELYNFFDEAIDEQDD